ncbi:hypothetical protein [Paraburkholderia sp. D1E]|uniref:hypothetical protein n=1 Tax=Paraburkholderia sp. D1E TaxID=3461398 RepID=UPI004045989E
MKIKHCSDINWHKDHPTGAVVFQHCLEGDPHSRENFMPVLGRQDGDGVWSIVRCTIQRDLTSNV